MPDVIVRKTVSALEEIYHEGGPVAETPLRRASVMTIIKNPFAGRYVIDIQPFMEDLKPLGLSMAQQLLDMLGGPDDIQGSGKGARRGGRGGR